MLLALSASAFANGLTSHQWITLEAVEQLPAGELRDLLSRPDLRAALLNGALFPDGGYAVGDDYGEMAHWEPFQMRFLAWIRDSGGDDADKAFLFGLASHGMGDQTFDSMFMERSRVYDAAFGWATGDSMDEATDVALVAAEGPGEVPEVWFPDVIPELMAEEGHEVSAETMTQGSQLAGFAIAAVGVLGERQDAVASYAEKFPWANSHIVDPETRCSPVCEAKIVAAYWPSIWDRLEGGEGWSTPVVATVPADGGWAQPTEAGSPESRLAIVLARGLNPDSVVPGLVTVEDEEGAFVPVNLNIFYGFASHVLLVESPTGWAEERDYRVTLQPGLMTFDGPAMLEPYGFAFSTRSAPEISPAECGCATTGRSGSWAYILVIGLFGGTRRRR